jgi:hypothetical protein
MFPFAVYGSLPDGFAAAALFAMALVVGGTGLMAWYLGVKGAKAYLANRPSRWQRQATDCVAGGRDTQRYSPDSRCPVPKLVLAYSGGLDTTTAIKWLTVEQGYDVIALNLDVGKSREQPVVESRGMAAGALKVRVIDAKEDFLRYFAFPALAAGAVYQMRIRSRRLSPGR